MFSVDMPVKRQRHLFSQGQRFLTGFMRSRYTSSRTSALWDSETAERSRTSPQCALPLSWTMVARARSWSPWLPWFPSSRACHARRRPPPGPCARRSPRRRRASAWRGRASPPGRSRARARCRSRMSRRSRPRPRGRFGPGSRPLCEPCQYNGQRNPRFYAACIASGSHARALSKRPKNPPSHLPARGRRWARGAGGGRGTTPWTRSPRAWSWMRSGRRSWRHRPLLGVPRSGPAAALPWQPPALPTEGPASCAAAHAAGPALARWLPRSPWDMAPRPRIRASMPSRGRRRRAPPPCRPECPSPPPCARTGRPRRRDI